jgi:hypothetical protein
VRSLGFENAELETVDFSIMVSFHVDCGAPTAHGIKPTKDRHPFLPNNCVILKYAELIIVLRDSLRLSRAIDPVLSIDLLAEIEILKLALPHCSLR